MKAAKARDNKKQKEKQKLWWKQWYERHGRDYFRRYDKARDKNSERGRIWREKRLSSSLKRRYGLTIDDKRQMYDNQNGRCAICRSEYQISKLHIDHDHKTRGIRGLLCRTCNHGLGNFQDNTKLLELAISYLDQYTKPGEQAA